MVRSETCTSDEFSCWENLGSAPSLSPVETSPEVKSLSYQEAFGPTPGAKARESSTVLNLHADFRVGVLGYPF